MLLEKFRVCICYTVSNNTSIILFLSKSAYIENKFDSSGQKRRRWQNDIRQYMHIERILFKFEDSGMTIAPITSE